MFRATTQHLEIRVQRRHERANTVAREGMLMHLVRAMSWTCGLMCPTRRSKRNAVQFTSYSGFQ